MTAARDGDGRAAKAHLTSEFPFIPRHALERALAPFGESMTLPASAYTSQEVFDWERTNFFEDSWLCLGRATAIAGPGDRVSVGVGSEDVLLVRDETGTLRGFFNVCRHRGSQLLDPGERGGGPFIRCPYHAWVYRLDGSLKGAADFAGVPGFDRAEYRLASARIAEWHGWVFANVSGSAPELSEHLGDLEDLVAPYEPERLEPGASHEYEVAANWKVVVENYHECYHCSSIHPELCRVTPPKSGSNLQGRGSWVGGFMELMDHAETMSLTGASGGIPFGGLDPDRRRRVYYLGLFPNLLVSLHPDYVMTHRIEPVAPDHTLVACEWLFPPEALRQPAFDPSYAVEFWDLTNKQDWKACESVQRGLSSRAHRPGPLSPQEDEVYEFIAMVARGYLEGRPARHRGHQPHPREDAATSS